MAATIIDVFLPYLSMNHPKNAFPIKAPIQTSAPTQDASFTVSGPDGNGVSVSDCNVRRLDDGHPMTPPKPIDNVLAEKKIR